MRALISGTGIVVLRRRSLRPAATLCFAVFLASLPSPASAEVVIALDANAIIGLRPSNDHTTGFSVDPRIGYQFELAGGLKLTPEVMGSFARFGKPDRISLAPPDHTAFRALGGVRLAFGRLFEPGIYAHGGLGRRDLGDRNELGAAFDAGLSLDYTGIRHITLGIQAGYNAIALDGLFDWIGLGIHAGLIFW